jgi:hypothetical protein
MKNFQRLKLELTNKLLPLQKEEQTRLLKILNKASVFNIQIQNINLSSNSKPEEILPPFKTIWVELSDSNGKKQPIASYDVCVEEQNIHVTVKGILIHHEGNGYTIWEYSDCFIEEYKTTIRSLVKTQKTLKSIRLILELIHDKEWVTENVFSKTTISDILNGKNKEKTIIHVCDLKEIPNIKTHSPDSKVIHRPDKNFNIAP